MPDALWVGIDAGTTVLKAAAFGPTGRLVARAAQRLAVRVGPGGRREQTPGDLERALFLAVRALREQLRSRWRSVAGLGLAAQGGSTLIARRDSGRPLTPFFLWNDTQAQDEYLRLCRKKPPSYWRRFSWRDFPGYGLARLRWLGRKRPALLRDENICVGVGEYLFFHLTSTWRQDAGNALQIGCYAVPRRELDAGPLALAGVPLSFVAPLRTGHNVAVLSEAAAERLGLGAGLPVAGPYMDQEAGFLAAAGVAERPLQCSLGTAWVGNFVLPESARWRSPFQLTLPSPTGPGHLVVQPLLTGNVTWDWGLSTLLGAGPDATLARAARVFAARLLPPPGLVALPWLNRPNPFEETVLGGAAFVGLGPDTARADLLRALAAGMCCEMARVLAEVTARGCVDAVVLTGGASQGRFFQQLFAALFDPLPVLVPDEQDCAAARGALFPLHPRQARAAAKRVALPPSAACRALGEFRRRYERCFEALYRHVPEGTPLRFAAPHRRRPR